ncbi:hypothetical protein V1512DRAFT_243037 [Lipomyces arxii]|uniref:uncharacterized protein n=1 Tax=Lipomyces arxii TaxID=56418 RepID=UPI0034CD5699
MIRRSRPDPNRPVETWDDDPELDIDRDLFSKLSTLNTSDTSTSSALSMSFEDELEQLSTHEAGEAASARRRAENAGIPLPKNILPSALLGGVVQRLQLKQKHKETQGEIHDWGDEFESGGEEDDSAVLTLKPTKRSEPKQEGIIDGQLFQPPDSKETTPRQQQHHHQLGYQRSPVRSKNHDTLKARNAMETFDDFEHDFELPNDLTTVELRSTKSHQHESDADGWGEESGSSKYTGSKSVSSNRSSIVSTFSPSSSVTYESEDEGLLGLTIPDGPLNFQHLLDLRLKDTSPEPRIASPAEDFFDGLEIGEGEDVFATVKTTLNKNIVQKLTSSITPPKRTPLSAVFAPKPTRIPRPVSQTAATMSPIPPLPLQTEPRLVERRLSHKSSMMSVKQSSNNARYGNLLSKKSMPSLRSAANESTFAGSTPIATPPLPSMPSWLSTSKTGLRRVDSRNLSPHTIQDIPKLAQVQQRDQQNVPHPVQSRANLLDNQLSKRAQQAGSSHTVATPSPRKHTTDVVRREASTAKTLLKPVKRRLFGDGSELDGFDDLPISAVKERTFLKHPGRKDGVEGLGITAKLHQPSATPSIMNLRGAAVASSSSVKPLPSKPQPPAKGRRKGQQRPHLIKPMGDFATAPRSEKGMRYNPATFTWEGNESIAHEFESLVVTPPRPALISNITTTQGVQVVGGMVFDPVRMCWFKATDQVGASDDDEEEDDPFEGFDDLVDDMTRLNVGTPKTKGTFDSTSSKRRDTGDAYGEFVVGEEFDVGPGFMGKQRDEEERWRRKVQGWIDNRDHDNRDYLYEIRRLIMNGK